MRGNRDKRPKTEQKGFKPEYGAIPSNHLDRRDEKLKFERNFVLYLFEAS